MPELLTRGAEYEQHELIYPSLSKYKLDVALPNGIAIEIKGWFKPADRRKMLEVKREYPALDIRMVLGRPTNKLSKGSKTTEAAWCDKHGFPWAKKVVPESWHREPANRASQAILEAARVTRGKRA